MRQVRAHVDRGEFERGASLLPEAEALSERAAGDDIGMQMRTLIDVGTVHRELGDNEGAQRRFERVLELGDEPGAMADSFRAAAFEGLGTLARMRGRYADALPLLWQALEHAQAAFGRHSLEVAGVLNELGMVCKFSGRFEEGRRLYAQALEILERLDGAAADIAAVYHNIGGLEHARGRLAAAEPYARAAVEIRERALGSGHIAVATDRAAYAAILDGLGEHDRAAACFREAIEILERTFGPDHHEVAVNLNNLAAVLQRRGQLEQAGGLYERALDIHERTLGPDHPQTALTLNNCAVNRRRLGRHRDAELLFERALCILERDVEPHHPALGACRRNYGGLLRDLGRHGEADELEAGAPRPHLPSRVR